MATANLPAVAHPLSRLGSPEKISVRGVSRGQGATSQIQHELQKVNQLRPITADQIPWRLTKTSQGSRGLGKETTLPALGSLPEGFEVKKASDQSKPAIPIFGNRTDLVSRAESRQSRLNTSLSYERPIVDELEEIIREKLKSGYYLVKQAFKQHDPEGRGVITRESLAKILRSIVGRNISLSQFNRLMIRLGLDIKKTISIEEFYSSFSRPKKDGVPEWFEQQGRTVYYLSAAQVHSQLKERAKQRFLDLGDLIPQINPGGSGRILKPELRNALNKHGFAMEDSEYDKLWTKYDTENIGVIKGEKLLQKLGISLKTNVENVEDRTEAKEETRSPRKLEPERLHSLDVERWLKKKFREGCSEMKHAFQEIDLDRMGRVSIDDFRKVLREFGLTLSSGKQVEDFLARCGVEFDDKVPYKEFLRRFQDRSEKGVAHKILANPLHRYHQAEVDSKFSTTSAIEAKLMDMFQRDFLSLLGTLHKIDRNGEGLVSQEQFRAAIESRFELGMSDDEYQQFLSCVPLDSDGMVQYALFMSRFDTKEQVSLFDGKSTLPERKFIQSDSPPKSPRFRPVKSVGSTKDGEGRSVEEMRRIIKRILNDNLPQIQEQFYDIDEFNSKRLTQEMFTRLMKRFGVDFSSNEVKRLWNTLLTDQKRMLEFSQFVRHFGCSSGTQAYPNAKISPPKRGDSDFMMRSNKLNSDVDMLFDQLRSKVDLNWERLQAEFKSLDPGGSGCIGREDFKDIIQILCLEITDYEADLIAKKFENKKDGRVSYISFLEPFSRRRRTYRNETNMQGIMMNQHDSQLANAFGSKAEKGLPTLTARLREKLSDDWMTLRRAFKKLDKRNEGYLDMAEFRSVLQLCNIVLNEDEVLELLTQLDDKMEGRVNYKDFLKKISR
ncbi:EF-hand calcium-binding domain-containing protein 6-like [Dendronephthya gigantea]|uniref:EF-hand calcium-binding domain-containing protein 6-like n=1 Tax=Dendronephthya gigantea TaxID=151771 RepID=UPI00106D2ABD|nr:EF-hand calcium-binding domain-containing protein 6-like [Dendronephthya gigantea]